ncbi:MAG: ankyrin repeat domain-containing protein, partial [Candidatus Hydrogenedentes bacterium]|nr:ankyrin repeat domain-containing protein [Candidatus Hydrogenedentota bacterium]
MSSLSCQLSAGMKLRGGSSAQGGTMEKPGSDSGAVSSDYLVRLTETADEIENLRVAVRKGRLFDVQKYIAEGMPLYRESSRKKQALQMAVETGFHSMVQILADVWPDQGSLGKAAEQAAWKRRPDLVWLLLECGADMRAVSFEALATCCDKDLTRHFLEHWTEIGTDRGLTEIVLAMPHPLTGLIKEYAARIPNYQIQLGAALNQFIEDGHPRWIALTMWMGADPRMPAPVPSWGTPDPECFVAPVEYAVWRGNVDALKLMKLSAEKDNLNVLLSGAFHGSEGSSQTAEFLIELGASINNKPNGGSSVIDSILSPWCTPYRSEPRADTWALERWIDRGARFVPDDSQAYRRAREGLRNLDAHDLRSAMKVLTRATEQDTLVKLFDTPKLRGILGFTSSQLKDHIRSTYRRAEERIRTETEPPGWATQTVFEQVKPRIVVARCTSLSRIELYNAL